MKSFYRYLASLNIYKKAFWIYFFLMFIEGAMRKWFMPQLNYAWMICREPIVIWIVLVAFQKGWIRHKIAIAFMVIGTIAFMSTLIWGHQDIAVAIYGFRIWFFHIPFIFIITKLLNREDLMWILKAMVIIFLPMVVLYVIQWASPPWSVYNLMPGGEIAVSHGGSYEQIRPPGTFGMLGSPYYNPIVFCLFIVCLLTGKYRKALLPFPKGFPLFVIAIVTMLLTSVSRGTIIQSVLSLFIVFLLSTWLNNRRIAGNIVVGSILIAIALYFISNITVGNRKLIEPVTTRFINAAEIEGGTKGIMEYRVLYPYRWLAAPNRNAEEYKYNSSSLTGYGLGLSSNYGTKKLSRDDSWALGEYQSIMITQEMGILLGTIVFFIRLGFPLYLLGVSLRLLKRNKDLLPISLWTLSIQYFCNGNINITTSLGFIVLSMILLLTSIKTSEKIV